MTCFDSQVIRRMTAFQLDACGRIPITGTPALKGLEDAIQTFVRTRQVDTPADNVTKTVSGRTCKKPRPNPTDRGYQIALTFCGANPVFEAVTGYRTLDIVASAIVGWEDRELTGTNRVALEVIFEPTADACASGDPQCIAVLIPFLEQWVKSGDETTDGETVPDLQMQAQTALSKNLFANFANSAALPVYLAHWAPKFAAIATGRAWMYSYLITCPTVPPASGCTLTVIDESNS